VTRRRVNIGIGLVVLRFTLWLPDMRVGDVNGPSDNIRCVFDKWTGDWFTLSVTQCRSHKRSNSAVGHY
jgi:hypothetical protein